MKKLRCFQQTLDQKFATPYFFDRPEPRSELASQKHQHSFSSMEVSMNDRTFDSPVFVKNGHFMVQEIACLAEAFEFLEEWPLNRRGPIFETAFRACQRAYDGTVPLSVARDAFAGFARSARILEDVSAAMPWMAGRKTGLGGATA